MPRKGHIAKREPLADPVYQSTLVNKFVNSMMWDGKKSTAQSIFYDAMKKLEEKGGDEGSQRRVQARFLGFRRSKEKRCLVKD